MRTYSKKSYAALLPLFAVILVIALLLPCAGFAEAVLPASYEEKASNAELVPNGLWWTAAEYLNIAAVKEVVEGWRKNELYDLNAVAADPVVVAVIDSGITVENELFSGKYDVNGVKCADGNYDVLLRDKSGNVISKNTVGGTSVADNSKNHHGTHVAGIVALLIHMLDLEDYIKIMPIKAGKPSGDSASFTSTDVREGIEFALANGADVVNMSLVVDNVYYDDDFEALVTEDYAARAVFVAASGNSSVHGARYPAADSDVIGVMNYTHGDGAPRLNPKSNYGASYYQICAPGTEILSSKGGEGVFELSSGTSMASPMVAFAAALAAVRFRATEDPLSRHAPSDVKRVIENAYTSCLTYGGEQLPVLDLVRVAVGGDNRYGQIKSDGGFSQTVGSISPTTLTFALYPVRLQGTGSIKWYVNGVEVPANAEGKLVFTPNDVVTTYNIKAIWTDEDGLSTIEDDAEFEVKSITLTAIAIAELHFVFFDDKGEEYTPTTMSLGTSYKIGVKNPEWYSEKQLARVKWYVNGKYAQSMGASFTFTPEEYGDYEVQVEYGNQRSGIFRFTIVKDTSRTRKIMIYAVVGVGAGIIVIITIVLIVVAKKRRV